MIHFSHFNFAVRHDCPLPCISSAPPNDVELEIGKIIAERLIDDRATLQMGIGNIPDAVLCNLGNHKDLGIHTDIMSDGMTELAERGAITNKFKALNPGKIVAAQALGSRKLYEFIHDNPFVGTKQKKTNKKLKIKKIIATIKKSYENTFLMK